MFTPKRLLRTGDKVIVVRVIPNRRRNGSLATSLSKHIGQVLSVSMTGIHSGSQIFYELDVGDDFNSTVYATRDEIAWTKGE